MASTRRLDYQIGFNADTSSLKSAINEAQYALRSISTLSTDGALTQDMQQAARAAQQLSIYLRQATDKTTGRLDLSKFSSSLRQSGLELKDYAARLQAIGPSGEKAFLQVASAISKSELPLMRTSKLLDGLWTTMKNTVRWQLTSSALHRFIGSVQTAYGYSKNLNSSLNSIQIVTEKNNDSMSKFAENANKAAKALSTTTVDYTDASLIYYQQGLNDEQVAGRTETTVKLANVARESAEEASEQLTAIWNNFYDGSKSLEYYADVMTALGASTASSTEEISAGLQKFAVVADTVGLSYEYAASALATITATTRESADVVGTSLRTLFARIQGLLQDKEQDDGTTLNKYSKALAQVGINIKDTSGEMKSMNQILDEMGSKWSTLSKAQQLALAQTVAGVRQYTQLIALMENWQFFQENLVTAAGAEGTLDKQAKIYADSWEAARDRVKAAAEDIYDSVINPETYISIDDTLTPILSGIADTVDALGGLKGILVATGYAITTLYGDKIAQSIRDMAYNVSLLTGKELERQRAIKQTAATLAEQMALDSSELNYQNINDTEIQARKVGLQIQLNEKAKELSTIQYEQLQNEIELVEAIGQAAVAYGQKAQKAEESADALAAEVLLSNKVSFDFGKKASGAYGDLKDKWDKLQASNPLTLDLKINYKSLNLDTLITRIRDISEAGGGLANIKNQLNGLSTEFSQTNPKVEQLAVEFEKLTRVKLDTSNLEAAKTQIDQAIAGTTEGIQILQSFLERLHVPSSIIQKIVADCQAAGQASSEAGTATDMYRQSLENLQKAIQNTQTNISGWSQAIVAGARQLASLGMSIQAIKNLGSIWQQKDLDDGEKLVQTMTSLGMIIPTLVTLYTGLTGAILKNTQSKLANMAASDAKAYAASHKAILRMIGVITEETVVTGTNTTVVTANTAAWYANPMFLGVLAVAGIITAIVKVTSALNEQRVAQEELRQATIDKAKANKEEIDSNNELIKSATSILDVYKETGEDKDELDEKTRSLADAYQLEGASLAELTGKYEDYNRVIQEATKKQKQELIESLNDQTEAIQASEQRLQSTAYGLSKRTFIGFSVGANEEAQFKDILLENLSDYIFKSSSGAAGAKIAFDIDRNNINEILDFYNKLDSAIESANNQMSDSALGTSGIYADMVELRDTWKDAVEEYRELVDNAVQIRAQLGSGFKITDDQVSSFKDFKVWIQEVEDSLRETYEDEEQVQNALDTLIKTSANPLISQFYTLSNAIDSVKSKIVDGGLKDQIEGIFVNNQYDPLILATLSWGSLTVDTWEDAYNSAKKYQEAVDDVARVTQQLDNIEKAQNALGKGERITNIDDINDLAVSIDWGNEEQKIIEFTDFLQLTAEKQASYLRSLTYDSYKVMLESLQAQIEANKERIKQQQDFINRNEAEAKEASSLIDLWKQIQNAYIEYSSLTDKDTFDVSKYQDIFNKIDGFNWDSFKDKTADEFQAALEEATADAEVLVNAVGDAQNLVDDLQNQIDSDEKTIILTAQIQFNNKLTAIENSVDDIVSIYEAMSKGIEATTNEIGEKVWGVSREAAQAIDSIYPGFIANAELLRDGSFALSEEMYQAFFDSANGQLAADTNSKAGMLANNIAILEAKKASAQSMLEIADKLASGEITLEQLSDEEKANLYTAFVNGKEIANGEILDDEVRMLTQSDTNWSGLWENVSDYSAQGAQNMADNVGNATGLVLENLEKIRDGAYKACQQIAAIGTTNTLYSNAIDTGAVFAANTKGGWANKIDTSNQGKFLESLENYANSQVTAEDLFYYSDAEDAANRKIGQQLRDYANSSILALDKEIAANKVAQSKLLEGIDNTYDALEKAQKSSAGKGKKEEKPKTPKVETYDPEDLKNLDEAEDRYHEINRQIERQNDLLDDVSNSIDRAYGVTKLKNYSKELAALEKQQENYQAKLKEANQYKADDIAALKYWFGDAVQFDENGEILNYNELLQSSVQAYNDAITGYNNTMAGYTADKNALAVQEAADSEVDLSAEKQKIELQEKAAASSKEQAEADYKERQRALEQYEKTLDTVQDVNDSLEDTARQIADNKLNQIEYTLKLEVDLKDLRQQLKDYDKKFAEMFSDYLYHGDAVRNLDQTSAQDTAALLKTFQDNFIEQAGLYETADNQVDRDRIIENMKGLVSDALANGQSILEYINSIEDIVPKAIDAAASRFKKFTDQLDHNTSILSSIKELYALQGITYKTEEGFDLLQRNSRATLNAQVEDSKAWFEWYNQASSKLEEAKQRLSSAEEGTQAYNMAQKEVEALMAQAQEAEKQYLALAKEAMETAKDMYLRELDKAKDDFEKAVSGGIGLDLLQDKFDRYIEEESRYFDKVNEAYHVTTWYNKLQADINKTTNTQHKDALKALQKEIDTRREGNKLSQYDLDILNAKYKVLQAQTALEDARNAKNQLQLVRDSQGNWNYQYTADQDQIADLEQDLLDAENEWYNIAKDQVKDMTSEIISSMQEMSDKVQEIYQQMIEGSITEEEGMRKIEEIRQYYCDKIKYLEEEKNNAILDMNQAGNAGLISAATELGEQISDLTGIQGDQLKDLVEDKGKALFDILTNSSEDGMLDIFKNDYAEALNTMLGNTESFNTEANTYLSQCEGAYNGFKETLHTVTTATGTDIDTLKGKTEDLDTATENLANEIDNLLPYLWDQVDAASSAAQEMFDLAEELQNAADGYRDLAGAVTEYITAATQEIVSPTPTVPDASDYTGNYTPPAPVGGGDGGSSGGSGLGDGGGFSGGSSGGDGILNAGDVVDFVSGKWYYTSDGVTPAGYPKNYPARVKVTGFAPNQNANKPIHIANLNGGWLGWITKDQITGYDTGGYTGEFQDAKLAFLHEKELVLNQDDTQNILKAVDTVRTLGDVFATIERALDSGAAIAMSLMASRLGTSPVANAHESIEQTIHIDEVNFPNVTSSDEIKDAFASIANDAAQWARKYKD